MLEMYYDTEQPLNEDITKLARRLIAVTEDERAALHVVLDEFFTLEDDGWHNRRCDSEIAKYQGQIEQASRAGKASAAKRINRNPSDDGGALPVGDSAQSTVVQRPFNDRTTNQNQNQNQNQEEANASVGSADKSLRCDTQSVVDLYHEILPELPAVRLMNDGRRKSISALWRFVLTSKKSDGLPRATNSDEAMGWIRGYFNRARDNDFLMGRGTKAAGHEGWQCDFDFLMTEKGKKHVIEKTREAA